MAQQTGPVVPPDDTRHEPEQQRFVRGFHGVRYQVRDVARSVAFYTRHLGFKLKHQHLPEFAAVSLGNADILLSGPGASGSRPMPAAAGRSRAGGTAWCCGWSTF